MHALLRVDANAPLVTPQPLTVKRGTTVRWTNTDTTAHTVTASNGAFSSPQLRKRGGYARWLARTGRFAYICALHPQMKGVVVVK